MSATAADDGDLGLGLHSSMLEPEGEDEDEVEEEEDSADPESFYDESELFFELIGFNQPLGSQTGRCSTLLPLNQEACAGSQMPTLLSEAMPREWVGQETGQQMGMQIEVGDSSVVRSVSRIQSLLAKQKSSGVNAMKPPTGKRRKSSNMPVVRSPLLKRRLMSPRMGHSGLKSLRPPSVSVDGSPSAMQNRAASPSLPPASHDLCHDVSRPRKRRKLRSSVWKEFEPIYNGNLIVQAKCIHCLDIFAANRENGRSACRRHLEVCKERLRMNQMVENLRTDSLSPDALALKNWKFDQEVSREAMVDFIVLQELPFSLVEHAPFQKFIATLNPWFTIVSRTTVIEDVIRSYENRRLALREIIKDSGSRVCLTADLWTSKQNLGYLCITCHFINKDWKLQKRIISFNLVASPHDGLTMFNALLKSLKDWRLEHKLFSITLDNAKNNNQMVGYLKTNLLERHLERHLLLGNKDMLHMRCAAHVLNLIVKVGFTMMDNAITHIRESVKYIRSSQARKQRFEEIIVQLGITCEKRPPLDTPTRWNSTYLMLKSAVEYRTAFETLDSQDLSYIDVPTADDWKMADLLCKICKPFYDATNEVSGSLYPTAYLYFHVLWKVKEKMEKEASNEDNSIAAMAVQMKTSIFCDDIISWFMPSEKAICLEGQDIIYFIVALIELFKLSETLKT